MKLGLEGQSAKSNFVSEASEIYKSEEDVTTLATFSAKCSDFRSSKKNHGLQNHIWRRIKTKYSAKFICEISSANVQVPSNFRYLRKIRII